MNKSPVSRFAYSQSDIGIKRSRFPRSHDHKTTISAGHLYPILVDEVLPGDTFDLDLSALVRMSTPIHPVMDNCYLDTFFFFVPNRLIWDHWKEFMGESPEDPYLNPIEYRVPAFITGGAMPGQEIVVPPKSLLDYLGVPSNTFPEMFSQLPVRAYCKIWNEWFRDQNLQNAISLDTGDSDLVYAQIGYGNEYWDDNNKSDFDAYVINAAHGGDLAPVNKYHDYFTSALKEPQKGDPVPIPLSGFAPVYASDLINYSMQGDDAATYTRMVNLNGQPVSGAVVLNQGRMGTAAAPDPDYESTVNFANLGADLSNLAGVYSTISDLRYAFQLQKFLEADNRGGTRYRELLRQHFNVVSPDASQQIPEFLGGKRIPINMSQVLQTSSTDSTSPQGNTAAYSLTSDKYSAFTKSFTEHGWIIGVACVRTDHTYSQGIEKMWSRFDKFHFYFPEFANISEQPIYNREIYNGNPVDGSDWQLANEIFGFQEPWAEYRYKPNRVSGEFRPTYDGSLDIWHYGDDYESQPFLSSEWIRETRANIDRTLAVSSDLADQFICDFYFNMHTTRVMPVYSIPGLADHH